MKAFFINATDRAISEVDYTDYRDLQRMVGGSIEVAMCWASGDVLYVNEEGLLIGLTDWFTVEGGHQPFAGNGVVCGPDASETDDDEEGDRTQPPRTTLAALKAIVSFRSQEQTAAWARGHSSDPAIVISSGDTMKIIARTGEIFGVSPKPPKKT